MHKHPGRLRPVNPRLLALAAKAKTRVICNEWSGQRHSGCLEDRHSRRRESRGDGHGCTQALRDFLRELKLPAPLLVHFQANHGQIVGTACVRVTQVVWFSGFPRLDIESPIEFERFCRFPNFWGSFILAVATASDHMPAFVAEDPEATQFITLAEKIL